MKHQTNKAFLGAYRKGRQAAAAKSDGICPYADLRGGRYGQIPTYSRSFRNFWFEGYKDEMAGAEERYELKGAKV